MGDIIFALCLLVLMGGFGYLVSLSVMDLPPVLPKDDELNDDLTDDCN